MAVKAMAKKRLAAKITEEDLTKAIRKRAQELYCERGRVPGNDMANWLEAERQVKEELKRES